MKIIWSPKYEIGVEVIDNQHRRIVEYINEVYDLQHSDSPHNNMDEVLHNLVDYTYSHFAFEEALMEEAGYSDLDAHQIIHSTFSHQIETLRKRFDQGEHIASDVAKMLQHWLLEHIMKDDVGYSSVVKQNILGMGPQQHRNWIQKESKRHFDS